MSKKAKRAKAKAKQNRIRRACRPKRGSANSARKTHGIAPRSVKRTGLVGAIATIAGIFLTAR